MKDWHIDELCVRGCVNTILPLVYIDSLTQEELLYKIIAKLNEIIPVTNDINSRIVEITKDYLDELYKSGDLAEIIKNGISSLDEDMKALSARLDCNLYGHIDLRNANVALIGDSNAVAYANGGYFKKAFPNATFRSYAVNGQSFYSGIVPQFNNCMAEGKPDILIIWMGNNDISRWTQGTIGFPKFGKYALTDFDSDTAFDNLNKTLYHLRNEYPDVKVMGFIRTKSFPLRKMRSAWFWTMINRIYQKWNVPVFDLELIGNINESVAGSKAYWMKDDRHYNDRALKVINNKLISVIQSGMNISAEVGCDRWWLDTTAEANSEEAWTLVAQHLEMFNDDPNTGVDGSFTIYCIGRTDWQMQCEIHTNKGLLYGIAYYSGNRPSAISVTREGVFTQSRLRHSVELTSGKIVDYRRTECDIHIYSGDIENVTDLPDDYVASSGGCIINVYPMRSRGSGATLFRCIPYGSPYPSYWMGKQSGGADIVWTRVDVTKG